MRSLTARGEQLVDDVVGLDDAARRLEEQILGGVTATEDRPGVQLIRERERYGARVVVSRSADQHGCAGKGCAHPDHRRDVHLARTLVDMLDLPLERRSEC